MRLILILTIILGFASSSWAKHQPKHHKHTKIEKKHKHAKLVVHKSTKVAVHKPAKVKYAKRMTEKARKALATLQVAHAKQVAAAERAANKARDAELVKMPLISENPPVKDSEIKPEGNRESASVVETSDDKDMADFENSPTDD